MTSFDIDQARHHLRLLTGGNELAHPFQVFNDNKASNNNRHAQSFYAEVDDCVDYFNDIQNNHNYGIYVSLNKTDGKGREDENIIGYSYIFADLDGMTIPKLPLMPHFITSRDSNHSHLYWRVKGIVTGDQFKRLQKQVAMFLGSDEQVVDLARVVRLAGTYNMKDPANPAMYRVTKDATTLLGSDHGYSLSEVSEAFKLDLDQQKKLDQWCDSRNSLETGEGFNDDPINREKMIKFLSRAEPAVKGNGRSYCVIRVASMGYDLGIPLEECQDLMWQHYNHRMFPPYGEHERARKMDTYVKRAYKYANNVAGCRTAGSRFLSEAGEVPEPTEGWDANRKRRDALPTGDDTPTLRFDAEQAIAPTDTAPIDMGGLSKIDASSLQAQLTNKSPVWDMARVFVGINYPDRGLLRCNKTYFAYTGHCWEVLADETIRSQVTFHFAQWKLPPSKISNICTCIEDFTHFKNLERDMWLDGSHDDNHTLVFDNGIVDLSGEPALLPHTNKYFNLNELGYDYDPTAQCPEFLKFLDSIWSDENLKLALQEYFGYMLTTDAKYQKFAIFIGKSRGGKGVLTTIASKLLGEHNTVSPTLESIIDNSTIHAMSSAKLMLVPEAGDIHPSKRMPVLTNLKSITGNDAISYHEMYKGSTTNNKWGKIIMSTNNMPNFTDQSGALANRVIAFPFTKSFVGREDRGLAGRLENELAGILNWAITGLKRLESQGHFTQSIEAMEVVEDMKIDMFPLADFVELYCNVGDGETSTQDLHAAYLHYAKVKDIKKPYSQSAFGRQLKACYLPIVGKRMTDEKRSRGFSGIVLNDYAKQMMKPKENVARFPSVTDDKKVSGQHEK